MRSRSSIFYKHDVHLFRECMTDDICLDKPGEPWPKTNENSIYNSFTMPLEDWRKFAERLLREVEMLERRSKK